MVEQWSCWWSIALQWCRHCGRRDGAWWLAWIGCGRVQCGCVVAVVVGVVVVVVVACVAVVVVAAGGRPCCGRRSCRIFWRPCLMAWWL